MKKNLNKILFSLWGMMVLFGHETNARAEVQHTKKPLKISEKQLHASLETHPIFKAQAQKNNSSGLPKPAGKNGSLSKPNPAIAVGNPKGILKTQSGNGTSQKRVHFKDQESIAPKDTHAKNASSASKPPVPPRPSTVVAPPPSSGQGHGMTGAPPPPSGLPAVSGQTPTRAPAKPEGQKQPMNDDLLKEIRNGVQLKKVDTHAKNASSANKPPVPPRPSTVVAPPPSSAGQGHGMTGAPTPPSGLPAVSGQTPTRAPAKPEGQKQPMNDDLLKEIRNGVQLKKVDTHAKNASSANKPPVPPRPSTVVAPPPSSAGQGHGMTGAPTPPPPPPGLPAVSGQTPTGATVLTGAPKDTHAQNASSAKSQPGAPNQSALLVDIQKGVKLKKVPENEKNVYSNSPKKSSLESAIDKRRQDQGYAESESESESESDWD
jgi:hypothetical protein